MTLYRAIIEILVEADHEADAMDGVGEMLRPHLQDDSCNLLDWQYATSPDGLYGKPVVISSAVAESHFDEYKA